MDVLRIKEGSNVADIGAGSVSRAARRVGSSGRVYAVEINRDYLKYIEARAEREKLSNVRYFRQRTIHFPSRVLMPR